MHRRRDGRVAEAGRNLPFWGAGRTSRARRKTQKSCRSASPLSHRCALAGGGCAAPAAAAGAGEPPRGAAEAGVCRAGGHPPRHPPPPPPFSPSVPRSSLCRGRRREAAPGRGRRHVGACVWEIPQGRGSPGRGGEKHPRG